MARTPLLCAIGLATVLLLASAQPADARPRKTDLYRAWQVAGSDDFGSYSGPSRSPTAAPGG